MNEIPQNQAEMWPGDAAGEAPQERTDLWMQKRTDLWINLAIILVLVGAVVAVYQPVRNYDYLNYDDPGYVYENPYIRGGLTPKSVVWAFTSTVQTNWQPLVWLSYMLDVSLFRDPGTGPRHLDPGPGAHHLVNVALHLASTILLFLILKRMTGARWPSAAVAALFALHPLHVESVAWISERKDVLSTFFWMLTMGAYVNYAERPSANRYVPVFVCLALGLMTKPMLVTLPCVLLLLDFWPLRRLRPAEPADELLLASGEPPGRVPPSPLWLILVEKIPLFVLVGISSYLTYTIQHRAGATGFGESLTMGQRLSTAVMAYAAYLSKTLVPMHLAVIYPYVLDWPLWKVAMAGAGLALATVAALLLARRRPYLAVGWLWFLGTLVPVIGIVQVGLQPMADRYTYVPLTGLFIAVAWLAADLCGTPALGRGGYQESAQPGAAVPQYVKIVVGGLGLGAIVVMAVLASIQLECWSDSESLFRQAVKVEGNYVAENNLAAALLVQPGLPPDVVAEALEHAQNAVDLKSDYADAHCNVGLALAHQGDADGAIKAYKRAIYYNAAHTIARTNLSAALISAGRYEEAVDECNRADQVDPGDPNIQENWGLALQGCGKNAEALDHFEQAATLAQNNSDYYINLALCCAKLDKSRQAIEAFRAAISLRPESVQALDGLAWILATDPDDSVRDGEEAVKMAARAVAAAGDRDFGSLDVLAAAYAEAGRFKEAVDTALKAQKAARAANHEAMFETIRQRLEYYRAGKPFRAEPGK